MGFPGVGVSVADSVRVGVGKIVRVGVRLERDVARKIEEGLQYPGQIKVTVVRETCAVDYTKKLWTRSAIAST